MGFIDITVAGMFRLNTENGTAVASDFHVDLCLYAEGPATAGWIPDGNEDGTTPTYIGGNVNYKNLYGDMVTETIADVLRRSLDEDDYRWMKIRPDFSWASDAADMRERFMRLVINEPVHDEQQDVVVPTIPGYYAASLIAPVESYYLLRDDNVWVFYRIGQDPTVITHEQLKMLVHHNDHVKFLRRYYPYPHKGEVYFWTPMGYSLDSTPPFEMRKDNE